MKTDTVIARKEELLNKMVELVASIDEARCKDFNEYCHGRSDEKPSSFYEEWRLSRGLKYDIAKDLIESAVDIFLLK